MSRAESIHNVPSTSCDGGRPVTDEVGDQHVTAAAPTSMVPSSHESSLYVTASAGLSELQITAAIETSKNQGWSELAKVGTSQGSPTAVDALVWEELKKNNPELFRDDVKVKLGRVIAEGGQAQICEAEVDDIHGWPGGLYRYVDDIHSVPGRRYRYEEDVRYGRYRYQDDVPARRYKYVDDTHGVPGRRYRYVEDTHGVPGRRYRYVAKVFKMDGFSLANFRRQWPVAKPRIVLLSGPVNEGLVFGVKDLSHCTSIDYGLFLKDGRFAFLMERHWGDLRTLINLQLKNKNSQGPPFSEKEAMIIMQHIALGVSRLHARRVLHRDLKAANVLIRTHEDTFKEGDALNVGVNCSAHVADFESSLLVQGTGFWRAPEVLNELKKPRECDRNAMIWTEEVDAYSYAMTCYEILTGLVPFLGYRKFDWDRIIDHGERPHVPHYVNPKLKDLMERCWHVDPSKRPGLFRVGQELDRLIWSSSEEGVPE